MTCVTVTDVTSCLVFFIYVQIKKREKKTQNKIKKYKRNRIKPSLLFTTLTYVRNRLVTELVILKVCNVKLSFNI